LTTLSPRSSIRRNYRFIARLIGAIAFCSLDAPAQKAGANYLSAKRNAAISGT
jgi:hypothetical protein